MASECSAASADGSAGIVGLCDIGVRGELPLSVRVNTLFIWTLFLRFELIYFYRGKGGGGILKENFVSQVGSIYSPVVFVT